MVSIELSSLNFGEGKHTPDGLGGKVERKSDLYRKSIRDVENNPMPPDDVVDGKVKEVLADKTISNNLQTISYLFDRSIPRLAEFWVRYSYDMQAAENREMTGWDPLPSDFQVKDILMTYYHSYFNDTFLTDTGKLDGKLDH